jgi:hypothetical protein
MRKAQRQQAETLFGQIEEAHLQIKSDIEQHTIHQALELLKDCQDSAAAIGTFIESTEGEGHPTVGILEEYCELVYQLYEELAATDREHNAKKIYKMLRQQLIKATNSFKRDVPTRIEAVFLPYKASMWDSLESVWRAADEDENCDAYVIPIPYYDKNPDGSFRKMHCEDDQYPAYVPITRYDAFDFEKHHPDMIYIHNPYDGLNLVTSVHPFFYSDHLKKFTDQLIYIPYFVLGEIKPEEEQRIKSMQHFCTTPGVYNADKVIVQSEDMRQVYIQVLMKESGSHSAAARKYWEDKILGLGSPKYDKVACTKKEELEIPKPWLDLILRPDGSWKKIILYNTSIGGLLTHNEKMLAKINYVLDVFRKNQEEAVLMWRPHPLIESTLTSMRPQLWETYRAIRDRYLAEGWGIYDDTADLDRAIAVSDAYYGDGSSVVQLYQQTGKPVMIQNVEITA